MSRTKVNIWMAFSTGIADQMDLSAAKSSKGKNYEKRINMRNAKRWKTVQKIF